RYADGRVTTGLVAAVEVSRLNENTRSIVRAVGLSSSPLDSALLRENAPPLKANIHFVGDGFFELFELPMTLGRGFTHDEQAQVVDRAAAELDGGDDAGACARLPGERRRTRVRPRAAHHVDRRRPRADAARRVRVDGAAAPACVRQRHEPAARARRVARARSR